MVTATKPIEIALLAGQARLLTNFTASILAAICGTGAGKTMTGYWWLHSRMEGYPGFTWGLAEPTYNMLAKVILTSSDPGRPSLVDYFKGIGHHPEYHAVDHILHTDFGQVFLGSADNPDSMQGAAVKGYWLDEAGQMRLLALETARQRCAMLNGQLFLSTTPYNLGWLLTEVVQKADGKTVVVERWRSIDRPGFPIASYEREKQLLPPWRFAMLYDALFERPAGLIYNAFNEKTCLINRFPLPKEWPRFVGHDFGGANPAAMFYAQDPATGYFYAYQEYLPGAGRSTAEHVEQFKKMATGEDGKPLNVLKRVGGSHQEEEIRQGYSAHGWHIQEPKLNRIEAQIDKVIGLHQLNKLFVFNDLRNYLDEKRSFSRELDANYNPTEKIADEAKFHLMACERYLLSDFTPETIISGGYSPVWKY